MEVKQGAFHSAVQPTTFHREHWMDTHIGGRPHIDPPQMEPTRMAPVKDGIRSTIVGQSRLRHSDPTLNSQTSSISIQLNRGPQSMFPNDHPFTADVKPINTDAGGRSYASRRAMSMDLHPYDEPAWSYEPGRTEERIVHIRTPSISDLTSDPTQIQILQKHKTSKRQISSSSTGSDSTDSDVINSNQCRGFRRLLISENGSVHEIEQDQVPYLDMESRSRLSFISDQRCNSENSLHASPELSLRLDSQDAPHPTVKSSPRGDSDSDSGAKFETAPPADDKVLRSPSVVTDSTRSQEILGGFGRGPNELYSTKQPASNLASAENSPVLFRRSYANSQSNGFAALPSPTPRRRELMNVELKSNTLPAKVLSKNVSEEIRRRQEKLWKAVNQKEQKKSNLSWFHESEAPRLIREFHLPRQMPPDGLGDKDFHDVPTWFHGLMNKMLAEQLLRADGRSGAFLTRVSSAFPGYVISYLLGDSVRHQFVSIVIPEETSLSDSQRSLTETASYQLYPQTNSGHFESLRDLIHFYMETSLASPEKQVLIHPVGQTKRKGELPDYADLFYSKFSTDD
ncbi:SH2 domain-containing protein 4A [Clonorchis sinensis]|uniref:SH2 domain-containing protein 4A n=1 Tax=Clonorchis sinensis TaxID=79923 RepID=G7Y4D7_CLOSI|nr:SH2 domain-containing protein 4A [Clonorchis sinensis]